METAIQIIQPIRASEVRKSDLELFVGQQITKALMVAGYNISKEAKQVILEEVPKDIQTRFKLLELPEIKTAIEDGVRGVYGEYFGINTVSINKWLKAYVDGGNHQTYLASKPVPELKQIAEKAPLTQGEIDNIMKEGIVQCFIDYQRTGFIIDFGSVRYDWLFTNGILIPEDEQIENYLSEARQTVEANAFNKKQSIYRNDRAEALKEIAELNGMTDTHTKIQSEAKKLALSEWFEEIIESKKDINSFLTQPQ